jgi:hypothetical protein
VNNPLFWLVLSFLFVTASLTIVLVVAIPTLRELGRAARSADKLFETLRREFPPTLEAIRLTGMEITDLTDDLSEGVQSAGQVVKQVDQSLSGARKQAKKVQLGTRSLFTGMKAAWKTFTRSPASPRRSSDRLPPSSHRSVETAYPTELAAPESHVYSHRTSENPSSSPQSLHGETVQSEKPLSDAEVASLENSQYSEDDSF